MVCVSRVSIWRDPQYFYIWRCLAVLEPCRLNLLRQMQTVNEMCCEDPTSRSLHRPPPTSTDLHPPQRIRQGSGGSTSSCSIPTRVAIRIRRPCTGSILFDPPTHSAKALRTQMKSWRYTTVILSACHMLPRPLVRLHGELTGVSRKTRCSTVSSCSALRTSFPAFISLVMDARTSR